MAAFLRIFKAKMRVHSPFVGFYRLFAPTPSFSTVFKAKTRVYSSFVVFYKLFASKLKI